MEYIFLVVAAAWALQFLFSYTQLQRFHRRIAELRRLGRTSVGKHGDRLRGRVYAAVVIDAQERVQRVELLQGWTVLAKLRPTSAIDGMSLATILATDTPPSGLTRGQWQAIRHAAGFFHAATSAPTLATTR
jgi:DNA-binding transcriptional regulator of glucitol operon